METPEDRQGSRSQEGKSGRVCALHQAVKSLEQLFLGKSLAGHCKSRAPGFIPSLPRAPPPYPT